MPGSLVPAPSPGIISGRAGRIISRDDDADDDDGRGEYEKARGMGEEAEKEDSGKVCATLMLRLILRAGSTLTRLVFSVRATGIRSLIRMRIGSGEQVFACGFRQGEGPGRRSRWLLMSLQMSNLKQLFFLLAIIAPRAQHERQDDRALFQPRSHLIMMN